MSTDRLSADQLQQLFGDLIVPVLFPREPSPSPTLTLLVGQHGAGARRLLTRVGQDATFVDASLLRAFHPRFRDLSASRSDDARNQLAEVAAEWTRLSLRHARSTGRSLVLDATATPADLVTATARSFANQGFASSVALIAMSRAESLLATASGYLLDVQAGRVGRFIDVDEHDASLAAMRDLVVALEADPQVDRLLIVDRDGAEVFDALRAEGFAGAQTALDTVQQPRLTATQSMRWLSELRAATDFALAEARIPRPLARVLIELHEAGDDVLDGIALPDDSLALPRASRELARRAATVREAATPSTRRTPEPTGPVVEVPERDRGISR